MSRFLRSDRGNATLITVLAAIPVVAAAGMAIDYSRGVRSANELQQVADAAALAAASGKNVTGASASEKLLARKTIAQNYLDYALPKVSDVEIIGTPAVTVGPNTVDVAMNARVKGSLINVLNALPESGLIGGGGGGQVDGSTGKNIDISMTSKIGYTKESYTCLLAMNAHEKESIYFQGNSEFYATCAVRANSDNPVAIRTWGSAYAEAESFCAKGGWAGSGFEPDPEGGCSTKSDPYAALVLPAVGACNYTNKQVKNKTKNLSPGVYCGGLKVSTHGVANLAPGVYIIKNGTLDVDSQSTLSGPSGVTIYMTGNSAYMDIKSGAIVTIKAPTSGTYRGMAVMQDRTTGIGNTNYLYSKGGVNITGAFYTPKQKLVVWANDVMNSTSSYFPMIVDMMNMNGTSTLYVNLDWTAAGYAEPVELKNPAKVFVSQ